MLLLINKLSTATLLLLLSLMLQGCFFGVFSNDTLVKIDSQRSTNQGKPLYVFIKEVEKTQFLTDTYAEVAKEAADPDSIHLLSTSLLPGIRRKFNLQPQSKAKYLGVYFIYTNPRGDWKFCADSSKKKIRVSLGENEIQSWR